jgi:hypothetical protein
VLLFGIIDGLGCGSEAAEVASRSAWLLRSLQSLQLPLTDILHYLDAGLLRTRGAAAALCLYSSGALAVAGVGDVVVRTDGMRLGIYTVPGVLGRRAGPLRVDVLRPVGGARIVLFSRGIDAGFHLDSYRGLTAQETCERIMNGSALAFDDASVLAVDFAGD